MNVPPFFLPPFQLEAVPEPWDYPGPQWMPVVQPVSNLRMLLYQYFYAPDYPAQWSWYFEIQRPSDGAYAYFERYAFDTVAPVGLMIFGLQEPSDWCLHFLDTLQLDPVLYADLPANFCTGA